MTDQEFKVCVLCRQSFPATLDFFYKKSSSNDALQNVCIVCAAKNSARHYEKNKAKIKKRTRDRVRKNKPLAQQIALQRLKAGCVDCGEKDVVVLEFDHLKDKTHNISNMIHDGYSLDRLVEELDKCEVRCANCHKRKTAKDRGWWKALL